VIEAALPSLDDASAANAILMVSADFIRTVHGRAAVGRAPSDEAGDRPAFILALCDFCHIRPWYCTAVRGPTAMPTAPALNGEGGRWTNSRISMGRT
jgi:hypothetical protein